MMRTIKVRSIHSVLLGTASHFKSREMSHCVRWKDEPTAHPGQHEGNGGGLEKIQVPTDSWLHLWGGPGIGGILQLPWTVPSLDRTHNTEAVYKNEQGGLDILKKFRSFDVCTKSLCMWSRSWWMPSFMWMDGHQCRRSIGLIWLLLSNNWREFNNCVKSHG